MTLASHSAGSGRILKHMGVGEAFILPVPSIVLETPTLSPRSNLAGRTMDVLQARFPMLFCTALTA